MHTSLRLRLVLGALVVSGIFLTPRVAEAQGKRRAPKVEVTAEVTLSIGQRDNIREYYEAHPHGGLEGLPKGIRKKLARGKPLPPGIAKQMAPADLVSGLAVPRGYEVVEVGLDVLLVEIATGIIHDVLMDVVR